MIEHGDTKLKPLLRSPVDAVSYGHGIEGSVWGDEIPAVRDAILALNPQGVWVNLCAGDGRYSDLVLPSVDRFLAVDLDEAGLARLVERMATQHQGKIELIVHNVAAELPFADNSIDGLLCNGSMHLFDPSVTQFLCSEILRIVRPGGSAIVDFSYDILRVRPNGSLLQYPGEQQYSEAEGLKIFRDIWYGHHLQVHKGEALPMQVNLGEVAYMYSSKGLLFQLTKNGEAAS